MTIKANAFQTIKIWKRTHKILKLLSALHEESLVELLNRLAEEELQRARERGSIVNFS